MHRIIYLDIDLGYKFADVKNEFNLLSKELKIASHGHQVICVLDSAHQTIIKKCDTFSAHADFIYSCYPNLAQLQQPVSMPLNELVHISA